MTSPLPAGRRRQHGVSSVLFMMLLGLGLAALVLGAAAHVRASQSQSLTVHAQTQAQLKAWSGAEALRQYLYPLGAATAAKLEAGAVNFQGLDGVSARLSSVQAGHADCEGGTRIAAELGGASGGAQALLGLVYCASGEAGGGGQGGKQAINIKGNLDLSGDLKLLATTRPAWWWTAVSAARAASRAFTSSMPAAASIWAVPPASTPSSPRAASR